MPRGSQFSVKRMQYPTDVDASRGCLRLGWPMSLARLARAFLQANVAPNRAKITNFGRTLPCATESARVALAIHAAAPLRVPRVVPHHFVCRTSPCSVWPHCAT
jgi:hypothetical protein